VSPGARPTSADFSAAGNRVRVFLAASEESEAPEGAKRLIRTPPARVAEWQTR
jgi:hypothetical protein